MLGVVEKIAHRGEDGPGAAGHLLAPLGELDARFAPLHEAHLQLVLELLDLHAEGGLADGAVLRRMTEMMSLGERLEISQLPERDHSYKGRLSFP